MAKREHNKEQHYKNIINKQKNIIKDLKKKARRSDKLSERFEDLEIELISQLEEEEAEERKVVDKNLCPNCSKGTLEIIDLKIRKMFICNKCNYRMVKK